MDECLPVRLGRELIGHQSVTVLQAGWSGMKNGKLLSMIANCYDAFITVDANMEAQQQMTGRPFGVIVLHAHTNTIEDLQPLVSELLKVLETLKPGELKHVPSLFF